MGLLSAAFVGAVAVGIAAGASPSASAQPTTDNAYPTQAYFSTAGNVRCVVTAPRVACERRGGGAFTNARATSSSGQVASVTPDGTFTLAAGGVGASTDPQNLEVSIAAHDAYHWHSWVILLVPDGTRISNVSTHGMLVSLDGNTVTPY